MGINISVVIPTFNEEKNLPALYERLKKVINPISKQHEIIFINDGSTDNSLKVIKNLRRKDNKIKIISFSRNFGHMAAVSAGLKHAKGNKIVLMDADLQDPPEIIPKLIQKQKEGFNVVYAIKTKRKENLIKRALFKYFYIVLNNVSPINMPLNAGTFSIMDKKIVDIINNLPERNKYFSGLRAWAGFSQTGIIYTRGKRQSGQAINIFKLFKLGLDGIISFSHIPLQLASIMGFVFATISFIFILLVAIGRLFFNLGIVGWASTMSVILLIGGIQLITLGIIGEYLARIYDEVKGRPEYIIKEKTGL
jgi:glycosyltransferase involved in cell wall biosynthesis